MSAKVMFIRMVLITILMHCLAVASTIAQDDLQESIGFYGSLLNHIAYYNESWEIQDNVSRIGVDLSRDFGESSRVFGLFEWGLNLVDSEVSFNLSGSTTPSLVSTRGDRALETRLGYLGVDVGKWGKVAIGKQYGLYYDVTQWTTDRYMVFGGEGSTTYPAGTDGGAFGTGRGEKAIVYRLPFDKLSVGAQVQLRAAGGSSAVDTYAIGGTYGRVVGLKFGVAYNEAKLRDDYRSFVSGAGEDARYLVCGVDYESERLAIAIVYSHQRDGNALALSDTTVIAFDSDGYELYVHYDFTDRLRIIGGSIYLDPYNYDQQVSSEFNQNYIILGGAYFLGKNAMVYLESRLDTGKDEFGEDRYNVVSLGLRYDFDAVYRRNVE